MTEQTWRAMACRKCGTETDDMLDGVCVFCLHDLNEVVAPEDALVKDVVCLHCPEVARLEVRNLIRDEKMALCTEHSILWMTQSLEFAGARVVMPR